MLQWQLYFDPHGDLKTYNNMQYASILKVFQFAAAEDCPVLSPRANIETNFELEKGTTLLLGKTVGHLFVSGFSLVLLYVKQLKRPKLLKRLGHKDCQANNTWVEI